MRGGRPLQPAGKTGQEALPASRGGGRRDAVDPVSPLAAPLTPAVIDAGIAATRRPGADDGEDSGSILRPP